VQEFTKGSGVMSAPLSAELRDRANDVLDRLFKLDEVVTNTREFRAMLEDLHRRDLTTIGEPHVSAIHVARAGILRAAIGTVMSCLDPADRGRGNRASVGQILDLLNDAELAAAFSESAA
jgi:hypothetical protein